MELTLSPLRDYCALLSADELLAAPLPEGLSLDRTVELVSYDSHEVVPGTLFLCKGAHFKPEYLAQAAQAGAFAYVSERAYESVELPCILVRDMRRAMAPLARLYYNDPGRKLKIIGITGTKGKTSTAYYLKYILDEYLAPGGGRCGLISSIETDDGAARFASRLTTPEPLELQKHFANAVEAGLEYLVMEVSSQALKYHRTLGVRFAAACFLNIGSDHVSPVEHPDFEDYFRSKLKIFAQGALACVNLDSDHAEEILAAARRDCGRVITFSRLTPSADVYGRGIHRRNGGSFFRADAGALSGAFQLAMPGLFNVENALAAIAVCEGLGISRQAAYVGLMRARVPGRMEAYASADGNVAAIVDFAHNRMSFEALFRAAKEEYPGRRIVTVFGCPGGKALDRRREMGEVSGRDSDLVILTEDDPGEEDTRSICGEIAAYVAAQGCPYRIELNRGEAIRQAVLGCDRPSLVLIAGRGVEPQQKRGREYIDTPTDVDYARAFLREYDARHRVDGAEKARALAAAIPAVGRQAGSTLVVGCRGTESGVLSDASALRAAGVRVILVIRGEMDSGVLAGLGAKAVAPGEDAGAVERLLSAGGLPIVRGGDDAAAAAAVAVRAERLALLADEGGVQIQTSGGGAVAAQLDAARAEELLEAGLIAGAAAPKVRACLRALRSGVGETAILDGRAEHALLLDALDEGRPGTILTI